MTTKTDRDHLRSQWSDVQPTHDRIKKQGRIQFNGTARATSLIYTVWFHHDVVEVSRPDWSKSAYTANASGKPHWSIVGTGGTKAEAEAVRDMQCKTWRLPFRKSQWAITEDIIELKRTAL